jgi:type III pantothenate kinase
MDMNPLLVVDVGNSRVKWGLATAPLAHSATPMLYASLPADDPATWEQQLRNWTLSGPLRWALSGVHPERCAFLADWARQRGDAVWVLEDWRDLGLPVRLEHPEWVGIDRLLDALAAKGRGQPGTPAVIVDAGSAVTVDWLDESGAFAGGAIFPGVRLMAQALHDYTALLPLIQVRSSNPELPGLSTPAAMEAGIFWAAAGGIRALTEQLTARARTAPALYLTGGDSALLQPALDPKFIIWPTMTLEGLRLAAEGKL